MAGPGFAHAQGVVLAPDPTPLLQPAGLQGLLAPMYDRVNGLSLPIGAIVTLASDRFVLEPILAYRSRLGVVDPAVSVRVGAVDGVRFEGQFGRSTRSNDAWNYSNLVNSATTFFAGNDTRNYFRANGGEGRVVGRIAQPGLLFEPFVGGRYERVSPIGANGGVWSVKGRNDIEHMRRPNPLVDAGSVGSALVGAYFRDTAGVVLSRARAQVEQSVSTFAGTARFTQLTVDAHIEFPTFKTQALHVAAHGVATAGDSVPRARYAYLGGSGTIPIVEMLELGGTDLLFVESRYTIPVQNVALPLAGVPVISISHMMGSAGVGRLPSLVQAIGAGVGLSVLHVDVYTDVARKRGTKFSVGISL